MLDDLRPIVSGTADRRGQSRSDADQHDAAGDGAGSLQSLKKAGGSVWESNPPSRVLAPITGFEVQAAHQHRYASRLFFNALQGRIFLPGLLVRVVAELDHMPVCARYRS